MMVKFVCAILALILAGTNGSCPPDVMSKAAKMAADALKETNQHLPVTAAQLDKDCGVAKRLVDGLEQLVLPCLPDLLKAFLPQIMQGVHDTELRMCTQGGDLRERYLNQSSCLQAHELTLKPCVLNFASDAEDALQKKRIDIFCCAIPKLANCLSDAEGVVCGDQARSFWKDLVQTLEGHFLQNLCSGFPCQKV